MFFTPSVSDCLNNIVIFTPAFQEVLHIELLHLLQVLFFEGHCQPLALCYLLRRFVRQFSMKVLCQTQPTAIGIEKRTGSLFIEFSSCFFNSKVLVSSLAISFLYRQMLSQSNKVSWFDSASLICLFLFPSGVSIGLSFSK